MRHVTNNAACVMLTENGQLRLDRLNAGQVHNHGMIPSGNSHGYARVPNGFKAWRLSIAGTGLDRERHANRKRRRVH
jgi:hypothetical protein